MLPAERIPSVIAALAWVIVAVVLAVRLRPRATGLAVGLVFWLFGWLKFASAMTWEQFHLYYAMMGYVALAMPFAASLLFRTSRRFWVPALATTLLLETLYLIDHGVLHEPTPIPRLMILLPLSMWAVAAAGFALHATGHRALAAATLTYPAYRLAELTISLSTSPFWTTGMARLQTMMFALGLLSMLILVSSDLVTRATRTTVLVAAFLGISFWLALQALPSLSRAIFLVDALWMAPVVVVTLLGLRRPQDPPVAAADATGQSPNTTGP